MADDVPLDFEAEDRLFFSTPPAAKRKKVIGLDELLSEFYEDREKKHLKSHSKKSSSHRRYNSDDEDDRTEKNKEKMFSKFVNKCQEQVYEMNAEDDTSFWGCKIFGCQKPPPEINLSGVQNSILLQPFKKKDLSSHLSLNNVEERQSFLEKLLLSGWLSNLVFSGCVLEDSIASWTFYNMLYTANEKLQDALCEFWCNVLFCKHGVCLPVKLGWFPSYSDLKNALVSYGYMSCSSNFSSHQEVSQTGPPSNIRSWLKVLSVCCKIRDVRPIFYASEMEDLFSVIIRLFLDRQLQGLSLLLHECEQSMISYFMENEWNASCNTISVAITCSTPKDVNYLRVVECISSHNVRSRQLRSRVAFQMLKSFFNAEVDGKGILESVLQINVKDKNCDFLRLYNYMFLADNWLSACDEHEEILFELWIKCLKNCSTQITSTDWRPYASKVRNMASYICSSRK